MWKLLVRQGWVINKKRVRRIWREENLQVKARKKRKRTGPRSPGNITARRPNHIWAMDFEFDQTRKGRRLKILNMTDEFTHEGVAGEVDYHLDAEAVCSVLDGAVAERGAVPTYLRCDNGPEFIAKALRDWCFDHGSVTEFIEPGSPWQNGFVESYNSRMRDELLNMEVFENALETQVLVDDWRDEFNTYRPHRSLNMETPAEFLARWRAEHATRVS